MALSSRQRRLSSLLCTSGTKFRCHRSCWPGSTIVLAHEPEQGDRRDSLRPVTSLQGHIVVHDLEFRYRPHDQATVSRVNLDVPRDDGGPRRTVGLGQVHLLRLLAGLLEPTSGSISYDGVDIADVRHQELRARIGFVLQSPYVFDATIAENIAFDLTPWTMRRYAKRLRSPTSTALSASCPSATTRVSATVDSSSREVKHNALPS